MAQQTLFYRDSEGIKRELRGCKVTEDKNGRFWIWSDQLQHNLAYKLITKKTL